MDELKAIFASNLIKLRAEAGLTQAELGEKIHYSDKSVSKWERAEAIPDAYVLTLLAAEFGVSVSALLKSEEEWKLRTEPEERPVTYSRTFVILCAIAGIWAVCVLEFVLMWIFTGSLHWLIFPLAVPLSLITFLVFNSVWYHGRRNMYIIGALVLSILLLLLLEFRQWQLLLLIVPAEVVVYLACNIRRNKKT